MLGTALACRSTCGLFWRGFLLAALVFSAGCKVDLYSDLSEVEANRMVAVLIANGISAGKGLAKSGFTVSVDESDMLPALALLNDHGFPKDTRQSIGEVFQKSGLMSSPFEERVRYIYALGEEVAQTLSQLDGVLTARVHIVLPDEPELGQPVKPSSAAVFIKHQPEVDLDFFVPQIRRLVSSSIEGLDYAAVAVVLAQAQPLRVEEMADNAIVEVLPGIGVRHADSSRFWRIAIVLLGLSGVLLMTNLIGVALYLRFRRGQGNSGQVQSVAAMEPS